ncbi:hypothetical protein CDD83_8498 [Cordyceps sp. RAO-2017]|nr:hypothetical protein CDD83_8498 [Cordyceps sp. RAO-2017]
MPADRLLNTVLQRYQDVHDAAETDRILGTTVHLLVRLSNPLNLGVLTSQLLTAPAIWHDYRGPRTAMSVIRVFHSAASRVRENDEARGKHMNPEQVGGLRRDDWVRAVVKGADDRSQRWQHLLVLAGVLLGVNGDDGRPELTWGLRNALEQAVVTAANLALEHAAQDGLPASTSIVTALNVVLPLLSDAHRSRVNCSRLLPIAVWAMTGEEGFCDGQFLTAVANDTSENASHLLHWPASSLSFRMLRDMEKQILMANMGPLAKLTAFAVQNAEDSAAALQAQDALLAFTGRVLSAWRKAALSAVDPDLEGTRLSHETLQKPWPLLWQVLKKLVFASVAVLQAIVSRSLLDAHMLAIAPTVATKSLHILRNLFFVSSRNGNGAFEVYTFSFLTSIDVLSREPVACDGFLREMQVAGIADFPSSHLQRTLDLFYLNVAEHLPLALSKSSCENLIVKPALAYLSHDGPMTASMVELFESAHSAILSVLSCPQHSSLTIDMAPFYIIKLFESFPRHISPRQFRIAFKTVMEIVSPPFPIAAMKPDLSETLLEMLRASIPTASTAPLDTHRDAPPLAEKSRQDASLSEQSALVLALIDSLPFLPLPLVEEWLAISAQMMNQIADPRLRAPARARFLDILVNGEMDVERSTIGVAWWGTKGGREAVLLGGARDPVMMSGAIDGANDRPSRL